MLGVAFVRRVELPVGGLRPAEAAVARRGAWRLSCRPPRKGGRLVDSVPVVRKAVRRKTTFTKEVGCLSMATACMQPTAACTANGMLRFRLCRPKSLCRRCSCDACWHLTLARTSRTRWPSKLPGSGTASRVSARSLQRCWTASTLRMSPDRTSPRWVKVSAALTRVQCSTAVLA